MKITEQTTLGELAEYLTVLGNPFITMMKAHPGADHARHAIVHLPGSGSFHGSGVTEAEALEAAFIELRRALLPEPLKAFTLPPCVFCGGLAHGLYGTARVPKCLEHSLKDSPSEMLFARALGGQPITVEQLINDQTYETYVPTSADADIIGEPLAQRLKEIEELCGITLQPSNVRLPIGPTCRLARGHTGACSSAPGKRTLHDQVYDDNNEEVDDSNWCRRCRSPWAFCQC